MRVPERVKYAREHRGLTAKGLSVSAGLSNSYVSQLERALEEHTADVATIENPGLDKLEKLAEALGVPVEWLAFGVGPDPFEEVPATERAS
jgi:transcriptional regulator with XRE-family HTH domain